MKNSYLDGPMAYISLNNIYYNVIFSIFNNYIIYLFVSSPLNHLLYRRNVHKSYKILENKGHSIELNSQLSSDSFHLINFFVYCIFNMILSCNKNVMISQTYFIRLWVLVSFKKYILHRDRAVKITQCGLSKTVITTTVHLTNKLFQYNY